MAITRTETQITWPAAANSLSIAFGANGTSEEFNLDATCVAAQVHLKADNDGVAASGDTVDVYLLQTGGDPDGAVADEFDSAHAAHALFLVRLDTNSVDPALKTVPLPIPQKGGKLYAVNNSAGRAITVSATITEQRAA